MENTNQLNFDEFVKHVKPDVNTTNEPIIFMSGYVGESPIEGHVRIYHDEGLNQFTDIPKSAIQHSIKHTKEENALGGSKLWVKQNALATNTAQAPQVAQQNFLQGDLYQQYANTMYDTLNTPAAQPKTPTLTCITQGVCRPTLVNCPSVQIICASRTISCQPSLIISCLPSIRNICVSRTIICQHTNPIVCRVPITLNGCTITNPQSLACGNPFGNNPFEAGNFGAEFNPYNY